jgi:RimJ/RimL family protein N-acetyltransferase
MLGGPHARWEVDVPGGVVTLRPEGPGDGDFLRHLFRSAAAPLTGVPVAMGEHLLTMQQQSQTRSYRAQYPAAWFAVIERAGQPCGRIVVDEAPVSCIVDYALLPEHRAAGLGTAVLRWVIGRLPGAVELTVLETNAPCLAMCRRLGFAIVGEERPFVLMERAALDSDRFWLNPPKP